MAWKSYYFTERWKLEIKSNNRLWKLDKNCLNYEILWAEIWNIYPEIFLKDEIWVLIFYLWKFLDNFCSLPTLQCKQYSIFPHSSYNPFVNQLNILATPCSSCCWHIFDKVQVPMVATKFYKRSNTVRSCNQYA